MTTSQAVRAFVFASAGAFCVWEFYALCPDGNRYLIPQLGIYAIPNKELLFYGVYLVLGSVAAFLWMRTLELLGIASKLYAGVRAVLSHRRAVIVTAALLSFAGSVAFCQLVLRGQPVADDESTYVFIARTLLLGRVTNPAPSDAPFFTNQFTILNAEHWHGKYTIGHPLFLALGEAVGLRALVNPILGVLIVLLCVSIGERIFDRKVAVLGAVLLALSPQFVLTCGTQLSQPACCLMMMLGLYAQLRAEESASARWALFAGLAWGGSVLVRPLPGGLFAASAALTFALSLYRAEAPLRARILRLSSWAAGALVGPGVILLVNHFQSGNALTSGYQEVHPDMHLFRNVNGELALSLGEGLLRENFWLFGWTLSLLLLPWARARGWLFWCLIAAELVYRLIAPKTVLGTTGPIYMTEIVPLLTLATADGGIRLARKLQLRGKIAGAPRIVAGAACAWLVAALLFLPSVVATAHAGANARSDVYDQLALTGATKALVFANLLVDVPASLTWAYYPPSPSPVFDDAIVFVRVPISDDPQRTVHEFWQRHFPDRRAFVYGFDGSHAELHELSTQNLAP